MNRNAARGLLLAWAALACACDSPESSKPEAVRQEAVAPPEAGAPADARFIVELAPGQTPEELQSVAERHFAASVEVRPLFDDLPGMTPGELGPVYVVHVRAAQTANPWDQARGLQQAGGFARVEPDLERTLEPEALRARAARSCLWDEGVPAPTEQGWSLAAMRVGDAWALTPPPEGRRFGEGVRVCHPDTGWTSHDELDGALDLDSDRDLLDRDDEARDLLLTGVGLNPGHGTATGSVIASRGGLDVRNTTAPGAITGVAPGAQLVEIRALTSVVQAFDSDIARAVAYATQARCDVVSMSLGGRFFFGLERAVRRAVDHGLIVVAASGNCVGFVVAPAAYEDAIAVAASNAQDKPWIGSSHGRAIAITAPGEDVWCAQAEGGSSPSDGTSFATAGTAGAAALWLAYHGRAAIDAARGDLRTQDLFRQLLAGTARQPDSFDPEKPPDPWNTAEYGPGLLNVAALLRADLRPAAPRRPLGRASELGKLAQMVDRDPAELSAALQQTFASPDVEATLAEHGPELSALALRDPEAFEALMAGGPRLPRASRISRDASEGLRAAMVGAP